MDGSKNKGPAGLPGQLKETDDGEGSFTIGHSHFNTYSPDLSIVLKMHQDLAWYYFDQAKPGAADGSFRRWFTLFLNQLDVCTDLVRQGNNG